MLYGWICPVCNKVNAPWVEHCDCSKHTNYDVKPECNHQWAMSGISTAGTHYRCIHCGATKTMGYNENTYINEITNN